MTKKYELTDETFEFGWGTLYRIRALKAFGDVKKGDLGGWIESEDNLSQYRNCWVYDDAMVSGKATVIDNAVVRGTAHVYGKAYVGDNASVSGTAWVCDKASICDNAKIYGNAGVSEEAVVYDDAEVFENASVHGTVEVHQKAKVYGVAEVYGSFEICGRAEVFGDAKIRDACGIYGESKVSCSGDVLTMGPIGSREEYTTFAKSRLGIEVACGCFSGTIEEFEERVKMVHQGNRYEKQYLIAIRVAKEMLSLENQEE